jgi:three-Cys-motif partner protein
VTKVTSTARPGGAQTRVKLAIVGDYLKRFAKASQSAPDRICIDGLAASGTGIDPRTGETYDGSARLPFQVQPRFTEVYLIEKDPRPARELQKIAAENPEARVINADVNVAIPELLRTMNRRAPTFAFLDPEGTELHWKTVEALARHKPVPPAKTKIELLILFPLQMCVLRLLNFKSGKVPQGHVRKLEAMLGAESPWREIWQRRLLGEITTPEETRAAFLDAYCHQLKGLGYRHVLAREVAGDTGRALYYLVFASDHDAGKAIMKHEFATTSVEDGRLFGLAPYTPGLVYDPDAERPYRY